MPTSIVLIGGPADGRTYDLPDDQPPPLWLVPAPAPITRALFDPALALAPVPVAEYQPRWEYGAPSRDDTGAYRYEHRGTPPPPHPRHDRPTPTLDELADMTRDPTPAAYPDARAHLLACRTRHSLRRDAHLTPTETAAANAVALADIRRALAERRRQAAPPGGGVA